MATAFTSSSTTSDHITVHDPYTLAPAQAPTKLHKERKTKGSGRQRTSQPAARHSTRQPRGHKVPVCLDHLKGLCTAKRAKCKFAHPQLGDAGARICEVFLLTGTCKFGNNCRDAHPEHLVNNLCEPVKTSKQLAQEIMAREEELELYGSDEASNGTDDEDYKGVKGILNRLTRETFASNLEKAKALLESGDVPLNSLILAVFYRGIVERLHYHLYADFISALYASCAHEHHNTLNFLNKLCNKWLYTLEPKFEDPESWEAVKFTDKRFGAARFMVELYKRGLLQYQYFFTKLDFLLSQSAVIPIQGKLLCEALRCALPVLDADPIDTMRVDMYLSGLQSRAPQLSEYVNQLVTIMVDSRKKNK
eukprot:TRINITY_DN76055_c0_g1_i1.p1 TRINITY_DN76055_c0_g1~~TRINITY_DN76055_c0_g1_i1.p1  ORF type:complete len:364 (-),score=32.34 TRINITY_DN76055_c0_g1_i1:348-1439(-)